MSTSGFGIAAQYERQLFRRLSVAGRFAYLKFGAGLTDESQGVSAELNMDISSWSAEGHVRLYPFGQTFFLNGMVGYGHISMPLSGELVFEEGNISERRSVKLDAVRKYVKYGGKLGWRIDFGRPGGFTFEPSLGYYGRVGLGDTLWTQLMDSLEEQGGEVIGESDGAEQAFSMLEEYVFIGGPRVSLSFGWRF